MREDLVKQFEKVGLVLKILNTPMRRGKIVSRSRVAEVNNLIFQMDIKRKTEGTRRTEWFEIFPGHESNNIQILDIDQKLNQILLLVREDIREFEEELRKQKDEHRANKQRSDLEQRRIKYRETRESFFLIRKTPGGNRHFLMGVDERQLFVAQLKSGNGITNIVDARKSLGSSVKFHEGSRKMSPGRQGEWFFVDATQVQEEVINLLLEKKSISIKVKENIGAHAGRPRGNPHVADELVVIPNNPEIIKRAQASKWARKNTDLSNVTPIYPIREKEVFVRGCIRHQDHKTIRYTKWKQVILNNEGETASATQSWID